MEVETARLEKRAAELAATYPNSPQMLSSEVNSSRNRVLEDMIAGEKELDAMRAELAAQKAP